MILNNGSVVLNLVPQQQEGNFLLGYTIKSAVTLQTSHHMTAVHQVEAVNYLVINSASGFQTAKI